MRVCMSRVVRPSARYLEAAGVAAGAFVAFDFLACIVLCFFAGFVVLLLEALLCAAGAVCAAVLWADANAGRAKVKASVKVANVAIIFFMVQNLLSRFTLP